MLKGLQLTEATQYITQLDSVKWTRADTRKTHEGEKRFHPFGVLLTRNEKAEDHQFMFNCLASFFYICFVLLSIIFLRCVALHHAHFSSISRTPKIYVTSEYVTSQKKYLVTKSTKSHWSHNRQDPKISKSFKLNCLIDLAKSLFIFSRKKEFDKNIRAESTKKNRVDLVDFQHYPKFIQ
ncbi:hypothetical protein BpHYR1_048896 [Brachionus plicatilis]|uniref:Uncharacterized protein n=1 Tax=Brachionus plicatilis TaxID=10195 RepID=A0A3M7SRL8_BRAPC|nr:hypothetical protein BpHYR1_048896 [Brachionus plicatilis]